MAQATTTYQGQVKYVLAHPSSTRAGNYNINYYTNACTHVANATDVSEAGGTYTTAQLGAWYNYATTYGNWWSATASGTTNRYSLGYNSGSLDTLRSARFSGFYVRCVRTT